MNRKHTYTEADAPTNTGSLRCPARFNWRMDCQTFGRFHSMMASLKTTFGRPSDEPDSVTLKEVGLPIIEHVIRNVNWGGESEAKYNRALAANIPLSDYLRERAKKYARFFKK